MADTDKITSARTDFAVHLLELGNGHVHEAATDTMAALVEAVGNTASKGTMTITVTVEPLNPKTFDEDGMLSVEGKVTAKLPQPNLGASIYYATGVDGQITRTDPNRDDPRGRD